MTKSTVYLRGLIEKIRLLCSVIGNKKVDLVHLVNKLSIFVKKSKGIIKIYTVGFFVTFSLASYNNLVISLISTLIFSYLFGYDVIHHYGKWSYYEIFGYPKNIFILLLIGEILIESIIYVFININNFLTL